MGTAEGLPFPKPSKREPRPRQALRRSNPDGWRRRAIVAARARALAMPDPRGAAVCALAHTRRCSGRLHRHHVERRSQGRAVEVDTADNLRWLCAWHHDWVHRNPAEARRLGLLPGEPSP